MTLANRMGQAANRVSYFALGVCGALLIYLAVMTIPSPSPSHAADWFDTPAVITAAAAR